MTEKGESSQDESAKRRSSSISDAPSGAHAAKPPGPIEPIERYDQLEIYCSKLGHAVRFSYCRRAGGALPCSRILDCWAQRIPIRPLLEAHFSPSELEKAFAPPRPKMQQILDIVAHVQARAAAAGSAPRGNASQDETSGNAASQAASNRGASQDPERT